MSYRTVRPGLSFEYTTWIFTRVSGASLILLAVVGMVGAFSLGARSQLDLPTLMRWTFFPNSNHVINSNISDVNLGWANGFWQSMQLLIVFFGATHGFNGLRVVIEDFLDHSFLRSFLRGLILLLWMLTLLVAIYVILGS
jgi:succinate dehydrogenase / fumarate reductase membrane anchor subunit